MTTPPWLDPAALPLGHELDGYRIDRAVGSGASARVYAATHNESGANVAIKVLSYSGPTDDPVCQRFGREARIGLELRHPNIARVLATGVVALTGAPYLVMELLEGETLAARLRRGPLELDEVVALLSPLASALAYAHAEGVVHRDVKPSNVFLTPSDGQSPHVTLLDFGVGLRVDDCRVTGSQVVVGTPSYLAPEQLRAEWLVRPAIDIYALGVVLYESVTGRPPFVERDSEKLARAILSGSPPAPSTLIGCTAALDAVILKAMAKDSEARFPDAEALILALRLAVDAPTAVRRRPVRDDETTRPIRVGPDERR